jgi:hypothetical protein
MPAPLNMPPVMPPPIYYNPQTQGGSDGMYMPPGNQPVYNYQPPQSMHQQNDPNLNYQYMPQTAPAYPVLFNQQPPPMYHPPADAGYNNPHASFGGPQFSLPENNFPASGQQEEEDSKSISSVDDFEARLNALKKL